MIIFPYPPFWNLALSWNFDVYPIMMWKIIIVGSLSILMCTLPHCRQHLVHIYVRVLSPLLTRCTHSGVRLHGPRSIVYTSLPSLPQNPWASCAPSPLSKPGPFLLWKLVCRAYNSLHWIINDKISLHLSCTIIIIFASLAPPFFESPFLNPQYFSVVWFSWLWIL